MKDNIFTYDEIDESKYSYIKKIYWEAAIGLNKVDNLEPSQYLIQIIPRNIEGSLSNNEIETSLKAYYQAQKEINYEEMECDFVSARIVQLLESGAFSFSPITLKNIHKILFKDIYDFNGQYRKVNLRKAETVLNGDSVTYADFRMIEDTLEYDFDREKKRSYISKTIEETVQQISDFINAVWQVHPFWEGNTRTTAVFLIQYLNNLGFKVNNEPFREGAQYFRDALVRANYYDMENNIEPTNQFLEKFLMLVLTDQPVKELSSDEMIIYDSIKEEER